MIPPGCFMVVYADPDQEGIYYDSPFNGPDRKTYTDKDLEPIRSSPRDILFIAGFNEWQDMIFGARQTIHHQICIW
jgi:hypothetical protein